MLSGRLLCVNIASCFLPEKPRPSMVPTEKRAYKTPVGQTPRSKPQIRNLKPRSSNPRPQTPILKGCKQVSKEQAQFKEPSARKDPFVQLKLLLRGLSENSCISLVVI